MELNGQRGTSLAEAIVAAAIAAIAIAAALGAAAPALHHLSPDARADALTQAATAELTVAVDIAKYDGSTLASNAIATTIPMPSATPFPATLTLSVVPDASGVRIVVTAATADATQSSSVQATVAARAPQPGSTIDPGLAVPAPTGAP